MWLFVRSIDGKTSVKIDGVSRMLPIEELRSMLVKDFHGTPPERQNLFFRGKQLLDGYTLFHYGVNINDTVQIQVVPEKVACDRMHDSDGGNCSDASTSSDEICSNKENSKGSSDELKISEDVEDGPSVNESTYYKVGDHVDVWDPEGYGWLEAKILKITQSRPTPLSEVSNNNNVDVLDGKLFAVNGSVSRHADDGHVYHVYRDEFEEGDVVRIAFNNIRLRSHRKLSVGEIRIGDTVLVNYNTENEKEVGCWYSAMVVGKEDARRTKKLDVNVYVAVDDVPLTNRRLFLVDHVYRIESPVPLSERDDDNSYWAQADGRARPACLYCSDQVKVKCKTCCCSVCGGKEEPEKQPLCEECGCYFHLWCLRPPLKDVPEEEEWYCPDCKNDETEVVRKGEKLKESKRKAKMPSMSRTCTRDWGQGMACVGRTKQCTIVPPHHFGPIPGVEVGSSWRYRMQAAEAGVHRPVVSGIHGSGASGAYSIVLSGGYPEDEDKGEVFTYTGSGGRDLSGNKRTAPQSSNQLLTRTNKGLALNCAAPFDDKKGATATDWRKGKPVRVLRNASGRKRSRYCPEKGIRYDGIYKVVRYWPEKGKSGFIVWRFEFRRDDTSPAPWTKTGMKRIKELGLQLQYPEGYVDSEKEKEESTKANGEKSPQKDKNMKRVFAEAQAASFESKRKKQATYQIPLAVKEKINSDKANQHIWKEIVPLAKKGHEAFIDEVKERFVCICCQDLVQKPVMTPCKHIFCKACLDRSFTLDMRFCPTCRHDLKNGSSVQSNEPLMEILILLFPGYEV